MNIILFLWDIVMEKQIAYHKESFEAPEPVAFEKSVKVDTIR